MWQLLAQAQPVVDYSPGGLEMGLMGVGGVLGLVALVLGIMVVVKMCNNGQQTLGIITGILMFCTGIGHLIALVYGWTKVKEWDIKNLMLGYTVSLVLSAILFGAGYGVMFSKILNSIQDMPSGMPGEDVEFGMDVSVTIPE